MPYETCQAVVTTDARIRLRNEGRLSGRQTLWAWLLVTILVTACLFGAISCAAPYAATPTALAPKLAPIAIGVLLDKTGSAPDFGVPEPGLDAFEPLLNLISTRGGELRVGRINDRKPEAMLRLRLSSPPDKQPVAPDDTTGNAFVDQDEQEKYQQQKTEFDSAYRRWRSGADGDSARFRHQLSELLVELPKAPRTDLSGAIRRADIFLSEPPPIGQQAAHRYLICATDGLDNMHSTPLTMTSGARLIIVNASGSVGSLESLRPLRFESMDAAINFVYKTELPEKEGK